MTNGQEKVPTGVKGLDAVLGGGLPLQTNLLLYGAPMCGKKPLLMELVYDGLKQGIPALFVLTDFGYTDWKKMMLSTGEQIEEYEKKGLVRIIDCYSKQFDLSLEDNPIVTFAESPSAISEISLHISSAEDELLALKNPNGYRVGFHSLSTLFESASVSSVFRFLQFIIGKFRNSNATVFYVLEQGMHDEKAVIMVRHLMDGVIEFVDGQITVSGIIGADREMHGFKISSDGFEVYKMAQGKQAPAQVAAQGKKAPSSQPAAQAISQPARPPTLEKKSKSLEQFVSAHIEKISQSQPLLPSQGAPDMAAQSAGPEKAAQPETPKKERKPKAAAQKAAKPPKASIKKSKNDS